MDTRFERILAKAKGFRLNFSENSVLDDKDGQDGEFRINKKNNKSEIYVKMDKKWKQISQGEGTITSSFDYDSGWFTLRDHDDSTHVLSKTHGLSTNLLRVEAFAKLTTTQKDENVANSSDNIEVGAVYPLSINMGDGLEDSENVGLYLILNANKQDYKVSGGNDGIFTVDNLYSGDRSRVHQCEIRLFMWKIARF